MRGTSSKWILICCRCTAARSWDISCSELTVCLSRKTLVVAALQRVVEIYCVPRWQVVGQEASLLSLHFSSYSRYTMFWVDSLLVKKQACRHWTAARSRDMSYMRTDANISCDAVWWFPQRSPLYYHDFGIVCKALLWPCLWQVAMRTFH